MFLPAPRQARGSDECGLFALAAVLLSFVDPSQRLPTGTFDLQPLRDVLRDDSKPRVLRFLEVVRSIYGLDVPQSAPAFDLARNKCGISRISLRFPMSRLSLRLYR